MKYTIACSQEGQNKYCNTLGNSDTVKQTLLEKAYTSDAQNCNMQCSIEL